MGRKQSVTKEDVYSVLRGNGWMTNSGLAEHFDVCGATIRSRVGALVRDNVPILTGRNGYRITDVSDVTDEDVARAVFKMASWMFAVVARQAMSAKPMKRLVMEARKQLPKDAKERATVRKYLVNLTHLIDWEDATEEPQTAN